MPTEFAEVRYKGLGVCEIYWDNTRQSCALAYTKEWLDSGLELAPLEMKLRRAPYQFISYAHNTSFGAWTRSQQMSIHGKRENITTEDLLSCGRNCNVGTLPKLKSILARVTDAIQHWPDFSARAGVDPAKSKAIWSLLKRE